MTERTIRSMAKELANVFYDENRTPEFRSAFPTRKDYMRGIWHQPSGEIVIDKPGWVYHIDLARKILATMLSKPDSVVSAVMKERIFDALTEEANRKNNARTVTQRIERPN